MRKTKKNLSLSRKKMYIYSMKKISFSLALALVLFVNSFAEKGDKKRFSDNECSKYEVREFGVLYKDGKELKEDGIGNQLGILMGCQDRLKGYSKEVDRRSKEKEKRRKEHR